MKNKLYILFFLIGGLSLTSCEDFFGDINVDPDNPTSVTPNVLLPQIQVRLAYTLWGDASRYVGIYTQHIDGVGRQFAVIQNYGIQPADLNTMWGSNLYSSILMDNRQLQGLATEGSYNHYLGVSRALEAYSMLLITDLFGDAPYSEAFQGTALIQPKFDSQESIYNAVFALITQAKADLAASDGGFPLSNDLIYGGDIDKWTKFLNTLEARANLHLAKRNGAAAYTAALASLSGGFADASDNPTIQFGSGSTEAAPWYQYIEQRDDIEVSTRFTDILQGLNDPRATTYGAPLDDTHPIYIAPRATPFMTYCEAKFIEAECLFNTSGAAAAHPAYLAAIEASFAEAGQDADYATYAAQTEVDPGADNLTLSHIMTQKHIAMYNNPESFSDWRRTNLPDLEATPNTGNVVPRRLPYAQSEILSNTNTPSVGDLTIYSRVWWDQ